MASLLYTGRALDDLVRLADLLAEDQPATAAGTGALIRHAVEILESHPLIGRPAADNLRELVISRGRSGYIALYEYDAALDRVVLHAIRHQREVGFED